MNASAARPLFKRLRTICRLWAGAAGAVLLAGTFWVAVAGLRASAPVEIAGTAAAAALFLAAGGVHRSFLRRAARRQDPRDPEAELTRGIAALLAQDRFGAEGIFREILARDPGDVEAGFYLGLTLREHGDLKGAARVLKETLRRDVRRKWTGEIRALLEHT